MLKRSIQNQGIPANRDAATAVRVIASAPLSLPVLSQDIPRVVTFRDGGYSSEIFAARLATAGVLKREHWNGSILGSCAKAIAEWTELARPEPLAWTTLYIMNDAQGDMGSASGGCEGYQSKYKLKLPPGKLSSFNLHVSPGEDVTHRNIGPTLRRLEKYREGLGQTVLKVLDDGLWKCCRGMTPRSGFGWAQVAYWRGELDEQWILDEELEERKSDYEYQKKNLPKNADVEKELGPEPTRDSVEIFRRADYEKAIPGWAGTGQLHPWKLKRLAAFRTRDKKVRRIVDATLALMVKNQKAKRAREINDLYCFEHNCTEVVPFILRWNGYNDPMGQIYDDVLNQEFEAGDRQMDTNAVFAFHDEPSLLRALNNLRTYLQMMQTCENLIRLIGTDL